MIPIPLLAGLAAIVLPLLLFNRLTPTVLFVWNCFFKPLKADKLQDRLDSFYTGQAGIYDTTRDKLLRGRQTMLNISAAHLRELKRRDPNKRLVWLDIGGGTGWNIEQMNQYLPIEEFDAVYVLDLCSPLLEVAEKRFKRLGWSNVHCLLQDATSFYLPPWETEGVDPDGSLDFVTLSYSLSMIPNFYAMIDRIDQFLSKDGLLSVCDFYVSSRETRSSTLSQFVGDAASRHCSYWARFFWLHWFELDHIDLHPSRRSYLEHKFGTIKSYNGRNDFIIPYVIRIPYYVSLFASRRSDTTSAVVAYARDAGNTISITASPMLVPVKASSSSSSLSSGDTLFNAPSNVRYETSSGFSAQKLDVSSRLATLLDPTELSLALTSDSDKPSARSSIRNRHASSIAHTSRIDISPDSALSAFHYGLRQFRVPYLDVPVHREFRTWIYGFTWEDPEVDMRFMNLTRDDSVLCITSAGDNALHYAIAAQPRRIHAVDMNPCQGHLLELKLAGILALDYDNFWAMFGAGKAPHFRDLLDSRLSPFLTSHAYQFWRANANAFASCFYLRGYSGWALRLAQYAITLAGLTEQVKSFTEAPTQEEQRRIWDTQLEPVLLAPWIVRLFLSNPAFLWNALGVPTNQYQMFLNETSVAQFATDTLRPVAHNTHISGGAYHYQVCLRQQFTHASCPLYLKRESFELLKADNGRILDSFRLHTDKVATVVQNLGENSLTVCVLMDLQDWFDEEPAGQAGPPSDLREMIKAIHTALPVGGRVFFRSAAIFPWYTRVYEEEGFRAEQLQARPIGGDVPIDNVNMYASFWKATKM